jgi:hypothetical protein
LTHLLILLTQHANLLLLRMDQRPDSGWRRQPARCQLLRRALCLNKLLPLLLVAW